LVPLAVLFGYAVTRAVEWPSTAPSENPKIGAVSACQRAVRLQLKARSTAEFAPWEEWTAYRDGTKRVVTG
jgi:hypothetical protein